MEHVILQNIIQSHLGGRLMQSQALQALWAGYGQIWRLQLADAAYASVILKQITLPSDQTADVSLQRKARSYQVEQHWYQQWVPRCPAACRMAHYLGAGTDGLQRQYLLLEDLDCAGFSQRTTWLSERQLSACLDWLAHFHAYFVNVEPQGLWSQGNYWHLATRQMEWQRLSHPQLKSLAVQLDQRLRTCPWQTLIHGDAKSDNVCFSVDGAQVAWLDFQYVGRGCGIQDVVYLLDSCLSARQCEQQASHYLDYYLAQLQLALQQYQPQLVAQQVVDAWRSLYPVAWLDFYRFVLGWSVQPVPISPYVESMLAEF